MGAQQQIERQDRVVSALVAGLEIEFRARAATGLADHFLEAEAVDFHWDARRRERWIGGYQSLDADDFELDRVAILGLLQGRWFVAIMIVDGNGQPHAMSGCRKFDRRSTAERALETAL